MPIERRELDKSMERFPFSLYEEENLNITRIKMKIWLINKRKKERKKKDKFTIRWEKENVEKDGFDFKKNFLTLDQGS